MSFRAETITEDPLSAFRRLRLAASRARTSRIAPWPSPEQSIGQRCFPLGGQNCWEVVGPALSMSIGILKSVKDLLDPVAEYLHEKEPNPSFLAFGIYMIGRDEARSNPTLLVSCERKTPRQKAVKLIRGSSLLEQYVVVRLAECPRPPLCSVSPVALNASDDEDYDEEMRQYEEDMRFVEDEVLYWSPAETTCGIPVYTSRHQSTGTTYTQIATIGGVVLVHGMLFGLSALHGFVYKHEESDIPDDESGFDISFDDWIDSDKIQEDRLGSDVARTALNTGSSLINEPSFAQLDARLKSPTQHVTKQSMDCFGYIHSSSLLDGDIGLDWALVKIEGPILRSLNTVSTADFDLRVEEIGRNVPRSCKVLVMTGLSGNVSGFLSHSQTYIMAPHSKVFSEMWTVRLNGDIKQGDSGSWVINPKTGTLYGQIVSGYPGFGVAYVMPMKHIASNIKERLGYDLLLPQNDSELHAGAGNKPLVQTPQSQMATLNKLALQAESGFSVAKASQEALAKELERVAPFEKEVQEKNFLIGKLRHEAVIMNDHLTKALRSLEANKPEDTIDKQLITGPLLQFLALNRSDPKRFQILQTMATLLDWTEQQKEQAGIVRWGVSNDSKRLPIGPSFNDAHTPKISSTSSKIRAQTDQQKEKAPLLGTNFG